MSWLTEGPFSRMGGDSGAARGARLGAAAGPIGMAAGALGGWLMDRINSGRMSAMSTNSANDFADRQGSRTNWDTSPMDQFDTTPTEFGGPGGHSNGGITPTTPFEGFGAGVQFEDKPSSNVVADELGITDWGNIGDEGSEGKPREKLKESRENDSRAFALQGVSNFLVNGSPVINGSRGYGAFGGSGQGYFKGRTPGK